MELDPGDWVVHRHVIDVCLDNLETWSWAAAPSPVPDLLRDLGQLDMMPVLATPGTLPSPAGGPSPAL